MTAKPMERAVADALTPAGVEFMADVDALRTRLLYIANSYDLGDDTELFERVIEGLAKVGAVRKSA